MLDLRYREWAYSISIVALYMCFEGLRVYLGYLLLRVYSYVGYLLVFTFEGVCRYFFEGLYRVFTQM